MASRTNKYVEANTRKARQIDIAEFKYIQFRGDKADYASERILMFYDGWNMKRNADKQEHYSAYHSLTPQEKYAVKSGKAPDPRKREIKVNVGLTRRVPVYYTGGKRKLFPDVISAMTDMLNNESAIKLYIYTHGEGSYVTREELLQMISATETEMSSAYLA